MRTRTNKPRETGITAWLTSFTVGERRYVETTMDAYPGKMRHLNMAHTRRPEVLQGRVYRTNLFTAVSNSKAGDTRLLICVERES